MVEDPSSNAATLRSILSRLIVSLSIETVSSTTSINYINIILLD
jgi:hypothetical protein